MEIKEFADFKAIFNAISDQLVIVDKDFKIVRMNRILRNILGLKQNELLGKYCYEIIHGRKDPLPNCPHRQAMECVRSVTGDFWEPYQKRFLRISASPIFSEKKELIGTIHIIKDLTKEKRTEEKILKANRLYDVLSKINATTVRVRNQ
ncbi:MAG: PAS domain-containing protein [Smithellaceae bacterium]|nr:PAS domain-containing protein [Smithellaceae bacterium]